LVNVSTFSNLLEENFGSGGPTTAPGIAAAYCFNDQRVNAPYVCRSVEGQSIFSIAFFWNR
jgi:hypothetical protein